MAGAVRLGDVRVAGEVLVWSEGRPHDGGRTQLVERHPDGSTTDLLPEGCDARSGVHEYGGGAWWVRDGVVWWVDWSDQRIRRLDTAPSGERRVVVLTPEGARPPADRYADGDVDPSGLWIACVRERHLEPDDPTTVLNEVLRLRVDRPGPVEVERSGPDFVASPRWSPDGRWLCWVEWDHPDMPWDRTRLVVRRLADGAEVVVAGSAEQGRAATGFDG